jgi:hypothetical protein
MTVTFGFYNSVAGDRTYNAIEMSSIFDGIVTDGVFQLVGAGLLPTAGAGMQVLVGSGRAWLNHTWTLNDASLPLAIAASDLVNPRIDTVIIEVDARTSARVNAIRVVTGTPGAIPVPPTLTNTSEIHQYPIAYVYVAAGVSSIISANITNRVGSIDLPFVTVPTAVPPGGAAADVLEVQVFS